MALDVRVPFALIVGGAALLSASCRPPEPERAARPPEPVLLPTVATIEIVPSYVSVPTGTSFALLAELKDSSGNTLSDPRGDSVSWKTTQGPSVSPALSRRVVVTAPASATATPRIIVVASLNAVSATDTIAVAANPVVAAVPDWIRAPHSLGDLPTIALIDGVTAGTQRNDSTFAFADFRELATFECNVVAMCGEITMFSPTLGIKRDTVGWLTSCDFVDFDGSITALNWCGTPRATALKPFPPRVHVRVDIWPVSNAPNIAGLIAQDTAYALSVFNQPWTGLTLDVTVQPASDGTSLKYRRPCSNPEFDITDQLVGIPVSEFQTDRITVAYVDDINDGMVSAFACPYDTVEGPVVLISQSGVGGSTLAHELGHAIGQWVADSTLHADDLPDFDKSNLMWSEEHGDTRSIRAHLTLGQLFQMSLRDSSFVKRLPRAPSKGLWCPDEPGKDAPCPRLAKDTIR